MSDSPSAAQNNLLDDLLGDFLDESDQLLAQLNKNLLQLDEWVQALDGEHHERCDETLMNEMFRAAHSLKGLSGMLGLSDINQLTHKIENVFDAARQDQLTITRDVTDLVFMGVDQLIAMVGLLKEPGGEPVDCEVVLNAIRRILQKAGAEKKLGTQADAQHFFEAEAPGGRPDTEMPLVATGMPAGEPTFPLDPLRGVKDEANIPEKYLSMFVDEAEASLEGLTRGLMALEGRQGGDALRQLLGIVHKIKGSAGSVGLNRIARLAHLMEDLLEGLVSSGGTLAAPLADVLLQCTDGLQQCVTDLKSGTIRSDFLGPLAATLLATHAGNRTCRTTFSGHVTFQAGLTSAPLKAELICQKLAKLGELLECDPALEDLERIDTLSCLRFRVATDQSRETILGQVRLAGVVDVCVEPLSAPPADSTHPADIAPPADSAPPADALSIRSMAATAPAARQPQAADNGPALADGDVRSALPGAEPVAPRSSGPAAPRAATAPPRATETVRVDTDRLDNL
ncbi:MAG: Hpt domain-containing protein, partial [Pirellulaceae bacterium]